MKHRVSATVMLAGTLGLLVFPGQSWAQEKKENCQLSTSDEITLANKALQEAAATSGEEAQADYQEALKRLEVKVKAKDGAALLVAAQANIGLGDYVQADAYLNEFMLVAPQCSQPANNVRYNAWARAYNEAIDAYQKGDMDHALQSFDAANTIFTDVRSLNNAAFLYRENGDTAKATELYRRATLTQGDAQQARNAIRSLAEILSLQEQEEEALQIFQDYLEAHPDDALIKVEYGVHLANAGREAEATPLIDSVLSGAELPGTDWNTVGVDLYNAKDYERATTAFQKAYEANPYNKDALENLTTTLVENDKQEQALPLAEELVKRYPYNSMNYQLLANTLAKTKEQKRALQVMQMVQGLTVSIESLQLESLSDGQYVVSGVVRPKASSAGTTIAIPFEFVSGEGQVVASATATIELPSTDQAKQFEVTVQSDQPVAGFRYQKAGTEGISG